MFFIRFVHINVNEYYQWIKIPVLYTSLNLLF